MEPRLREDDGLGGRRAATCRARNAVYFFAGTKKPAKAGFFIQQEQRYQAASAMALMCAFRRLLWRAALFLLMMPLSAMRSMTGTAAV